MQLKLKQFLFYTFLYLALSFFIFGMLNTIAQYVSLKPDIGFLEFKQDYIHITTWRIAFYVHVFSSIFTLTAGLSQFSNYILQNHKSLHRFIGRLYVIDILIINFPAALIMAYYANGGLPSKIAFTILDVLWFWFTLKAFLAIKKRDIITHKKFMIRSYALTFSAITLRMWKLVLSNIFEIDDATLYMIDAWLGFVPNLLIAEIIISRMNLKKQLSPERK